MVTTQLTTLFAIVSITTLAAIGLCYGLDGAMFATALATIAGLGGYAARVNSQGKNGKSP